MEHRSISAEAIMESPAVLTAAASPRRREILRMLWNEERAAGDIHRAMPDITFGAVSQQLKWLLEAGLVESRSEKRFHYYRARREAFGPVGRMLERMWDDALWRLKLAAELEESRRGPRPQAARSSDQDAPGREVSDPKASNESPDHKEKTQ